MLVLSEYLLSRKHGGAIASVGGFAVRVAFRLVVVAVVIVAFAVVAGRCFLSLQGLDFGRQSLVGVISSPELILKAPELLE